MYVESVFVLNPEGEDTLTVTIRILESNVFVSGSEISIMSSSLSFLYTSLNVTVRVNEFVVVAVVVDFHKPPSK